MAESLHVGTGSVVLRPGSREDLEREICFSVHRHGSCDVKNHTLKGQLKCETEEQIIAWKQSFSTREELAYEPYEGLADQEGVEAGVIFTRIPLTGS